MQLRNARRVLPAALLLVSVVALYGGAAGASHRSGQSGYAAFNFSSLGGTSSGGNSINDLGLVTGYSNLEGDETRHATAWLYGLTFDLGTLGGPNSSVLWPVKNDKGIIAGVAETGETDPLGENWSCSAFFPGDPSGHVCQGFVWEKGVMSALPTLGGTHSFATGANNSGLVVGWAENTFHDPTCVAPQVLQFRATLWEPDRDEVQELPPLPGDTVSAATAINDRGQVVGISGICDNAVGRFSAAHSVLWEDGEVTNIGDLGGVAWNTPMAINDHGQVVGFSNVSAEDGGSFNARAFLWTEENGIVDLGTLPGDATSQALGINNRGQVVGLSCTEGFASCRGFLWQDGVMMDLNALVGLGYDDHIYNANDINDFGMITGQAVDDETGDALTFLAIPIPGPASGGFDGEAITVGIESGALTPETVLPDQVRQALLLQLGLAGVEDWDR
jgi:probable HAF family extracellular repeat protein